LDYSTIEFGKLAHSLRILITMDSQTRKALVRKRAAVKTKMMHIKKYIDNLPYTVVEHDITVRLQLLEGCGRNTVLHRISWNSRTTMKRNNMS